MCNNENMKIDDKIILAIDTLIEYELKEIRQSYLVETLAKQNNMSKNEIAEMYDRNHVEEKYTLGSCGDLAFLLKTLFKNKVECVGEYNRSDKNKKCYHVYTRSKESGLLYDIKGAHSEHEIKKNKLRLRELDFNDSSFMMCTNNADYPPIFDPIINYVKNKIEGPSEEREF